jgi:holliday junction DNA helicase RuvA
MIGKIAGRVDYVAEDHALIEAAGVGYIVHCSPRTLSRLPPSGEVGALYTELVVREDLMQLYGFLTLAEKEWHRLLCSVQGVGAKAALSILGALGPDALGRAIALGDAAAIKAAPGVGPKLAARVANELKDKAPAVMALGGGGARPAMSAVPADPEGIRPPAAPAARMAGGRPAGRDESQGADPAPAQADALSALVNLGYGMGDAAAAVATASAEDETRDAAALIKAALKALAPKS